MAKKKSDKHNTSLRLSSRILRELKLRAAAEGSSVQRIIERLIEDFLAGK